MAAQIRPGITSVLANEALYRTRLAYVQATSGFTPAALNQPQWFVDGVNGSDQNPGTDALHPFLTMTHLFSLWGKGNTLQPSVGSSVTVNFQNLPLTGDIPNLDVILGQGVSLIFVGTNPTNVPLAVSAVRAQVRSSNTPGGLTLTGGNAAPFVLGGATPNVRILDTTTNGYFWGAKNEGAGVLRISEPLSAPAPGGTINSTNRVTLTNTDTFVTQALQQMVLGEWRIGGLRNTGGTRASVVFVDAFLRITDAFEWTIDGGVDCLWYGCIFGKSPEMFTGGRFLFWENCAVAGQPISGGTQIMLKGDYLEMDGGLYNGIAIVRDIGSYLRLDMDVMFQGCCLPFFAGAVSIGTMQIFDAPTLNPLNPNGHAILCGIQNPVVMLPGSDSTAAIWGAGSAGSGLFVAANSSFQYQAGLVANLTITGSTPGTNDFEMNGQTSSYSPSVTGTPGGPFTNSWANFQNASDFNGIAYNPLSDSWILAQNS